MTPPETILDRYVRENLPKSYSGKLNIELVGSPSLRTFLYGLQIEMNDALRLENANASGGVVHPPFHFDYIHANVKNAHAIPHECFWFVAVTLPLIKSVVDVSRRLSRSSVVLRLLHLDSGSFRPDILWGYLGQIQLMFLTSHEYTHLIHGHIARRESSGMWTELVPPTACGNIDSQVEELDADGYATYLVLTFLLRSERRQRALIQLEQTNIPAADCDELILSCFFLALMALFCTLWPESVSVPLDELKHPPVPVRVEYVIEVAKMWCGQFGSVEQSWFASLHLQDLFHAAASEVDGTTRQGWDSQIALLSSADGVQYRNLLFEKSNKLRRRE
ncbi:MAG: hypothetical protein ABR898_03395 [Terracidiphilus sp.]|jgi:hypothetical protein